MVEGSLELYYGRNEKSEVLVQTKMETKKMKTFKFKKAYFLRISKNNKTYQKINIKAIGLQKIVTDSTGKQYQLFLQDDLKFHVDIPLNDPNIGVIIDGLFWAICPYSTARRDLNKIDEIIKKNSIHELNLKGLESIKDFKQLGE